LQLFLNFDLLFSIPVINYDLVRCLKRNNGQGHFFQQKTILPPAFALFLIFPGRRLSIFLKEVLSTEAPSGMVPFHGLFSLKDKDIVGDGHFSGKAGSLPEPFCINREGMFENFRGGLYNNDK